MIRTDSKCPPPPPTLVPKVKVIFCGFTLEMLVKVGHFREESFLLL